MSVAKPSKAVNATMPALLLLAAATTGLGVAQAQPRPGQPLALVFPPGVTEGAALLSVLAEPGWDPITIRRLGPVTLALVAPTSLASASNPAGTWLVLPAFGRAPCAGAVRPDLSGKPI